MVKIFVGRLAPAVSPTQLRELFEKYGPVSDCDILRDYGFVHMSHESDAQRAISELDKFELCGSRLSVEMSTSRSMKSCQLTVKNLPDGITTQDLHKLFKKFGTVTLCRIHNNTATVHMRFPSMATNAVRNLSGELYRGNVLSVEFANNTNKPASVWTKKSDVTVNETFNGVTSPEPKQIVSTTHQVNSGRMAWNQPEPSNQSNTDKIKTTNEGSSTNLLTSNTSKVLEIREKRSSRIKQGLKFLQSPMPWNGTAELYETFLNQLKEMLLAEGLDLYREGHSKEAIVQLSEAINISNYMKTEGINGHMENQDRLYMERATMKFNMGSTTEALEDADQALNISNGTNQTVLRFKARLLVDCGRRSEAYALMMNFQQSNTLDAESTQFFNILKQTMGVNDDENIGFTNTKGAIGDGRNRSLFHSPFSEHTVKSHNNYNMARSSWPEKNGTSDNNSSYFLPYSNFNSSGSLLSNIQGLPATGSFSQRESYFQQFFNQGNALSTGFNSYQSGQLDNSGTSPGPVSRPGNQLFAPSAFQPTLSTSLFSSPLYNLNEQMNGNSSDLSIPLPIGFRRPTSSSFSSTGNSPWNDNNALGLGSVGSEPSVDKTVDEELARAIEEELSVTSSNSFVSQGHVWQGNIEQPNNQLPFKDANTPSYSHFPSHPSKGGYTGSVLGPAMLGIHTSSPKTTAAPSSTIIPAAEPVTPSVSTASISQELVDNNDSLSEILRNPLHDTHEFKMGCTECVLRTGSRVIDIRHDETIAHTCYKNILLCRRRGNTNWLKIRPRPQPQSKAQLYDGPYYICKDLMSGQDCTYPAVCTFAYNQEEIDVWTLERKGMLNRSWLCKSMDSNFVKNLSLVGLILCKHRGVFDFLCKLCFQNKPRIISKFNQSLGKCTNENTPHRFKPEHQQLTHILREGTVRYTEIRSPIQQAILCRHAIRFQCSRGADCHFAHSLVERDIWAIMDKENLSASDIVKQSNDHVSKHTGTGLNSDAPPLFTSNGSLSTFRWKAKFICSLCHKNGQMSEATKDLKYCTARAQHSWTTNKKVMLVSTSKSWVQIRDLPYLKNKNLPVRFELCENYRRQKKCSFSGKCNFAHSQEEMDIWMYLRENQLKDLEELYEALAKEKQSKQAKRKPAQVQEACNIILPTDILPQSTYHCWLCDKECNSNRQWEQHCSSEKHKLRAISDSDGHWKFRKPGGNYKLCERHEKGVCEYDFLPVSDNICSSAHGKEELEEWIHRRQYVINRIQRAQDDHLIDSSQDMDNLINQPPQS